MPSLHNLPSLQDIPAHPFTELEVVYFLLPRVAVALLVGTLVGIEREYRGKMAGIKTNALICAASSLFTAASILMTNFHAADATRSVDVTRIAAQIVSGIGFLGAGAIFKSSNKVNGLTTAAVIWTVASLGILIGFGIYLSSIVVTILLISFLTIVAQLERRIFKSHGGHIGYQTVMQKKAEENATPKPFILD